MAGNTAGSAPQRPELRSAGDASALAEPPPPQPSQLADDYTLGLNWSMGVDVAAMRGTQAAIDQQLAYNARRDGEDAAAADAAAQQEAFNLARQQQEAVAAAGGGLSPGGRALRERQRLQGRARQAGFTDRAFEAATGAPAAGGQREQQEAPGVSDAGATGRWAAAGSGLVLDALPGCGVPAHTTTVTLALPPVSCTPSCTGSRTKRG